MKGVLVCLLLAVGLVNGSGFWWHSKSSKSDSNRPVLAGSFISSFIVSVQTNSTSPASAVLKGAYAWDNNTGAGVLDIASDDALPFRFEAYVTAVLEKSASSAAPRLVARSERSGSSCWMAEVDANSTFMSMWSDRVPDAAEHVGDELQHGVNCSVWLLGSEDHGPYLKIWVSHVDSTIVRKIFSHGRHHPVVDIQFTNTVVGPIDKVLLPTPSSCIEQDIDVIPSAMRALHVGIRSAIGMMTDFHYHHLHHGHGHGPFGKHGGFGRHGHRGGRPHRDDDREDDRHDRDHHEDDHDDEDDELEVEHDGQRDGGEERQHDRDDGENESGRHHGDGHRGRHHRRHMFF